MATSPTLSRASSVMAWLSLLAAVLVAATATIGILFPVEIHHGGLQLCVQLTLPGGQKVTALTPFLYRLGVFAVAIIPVGLKLFMLLSLFALFRRFALGRVFDSETLALIRRVASLLVAMVLANIIAQPIILNILGRAAGQFWLGYLITGDELPQLFAAGAVLVAARVMAEARRIADENASFV